MSKGDVEYQELRLNSIVKHLIIQDYLPTWCHILSSYNQKLNYFDCFAGPGKYIWNKQEVDGSPVVAIREINNLIQSGSLNKPKEVNLVFIEDDNKQIQTLNKAISSINYDKNKLKVQVVYNDAEHTISGLLGGLDNIAPSFFFIDPYHLPVSVGVMKRIMNHDKTEILLNLMFFEIIRNINNPQEKEKIEAVFGKEIFEVDIKTDDDRFDSQKIVSYVADRVGAKYYIPFKVYFGPDEKGPSTRLKYLLVYFTNNHKGFNLMIDVMWKHSQEGSPLMVSDGQQVLFPIKEVDSLKKLIKENYIGSNVSISFEDFVEKNWKWYFREQDFRKVLKELRTDGIIKVTSVSSKRKDGLNGADLIKF